MEKAHEGIVILQNGKVRYLNPPMAELIGYERDEVINLAVTRFISFDMLNRLKQHLLSSRDKSDNLGVFETDLQHKSGSLIPVEANIGKAKFEGKTAVFLFFRDIRTRRKRDFEKIKMGKLESISTLADGMAHDFNNLLTIILGNASIMKNMVSDNERLTRSVDKIEDASVRASKLIKQFFDFSQTGRSTKQKLQLGERLREVLEGQFDSTDYRLKLNIAADLWPIECDPIQIEEVVSKMCSNAKDAMSAGGVVEFTAENYQEKNVSSQLKTGKYIVFKFRDEGVGIPKENIAKIFDPYFSTKKSVTEKGIGFGLSIVQNIVYNHGGTIQVESEPDRGTTFFLYFPAPAD